MPISLFQRTTELAEAESKVLYSVAEVDIRQHTEPAEINFTFINNIAAQKIVT